VTLTFDLWPWKSIGFQTLLRTKYVPSLVKIHWRMLILECSQGCYMVTNLPSDLDLWPMTLKINRVPDSPKDEVCTKFSQNPLKDVDSRVFTRMWRTDGRKDGSVTISLRNFVGKGIIKTNFKQITRIELKLTNLLQYSQNLSISTIEGNSE
jgi:hypothetical protein